MTAKTMTAKTMTAKTKTKPPVRPVLTRPIPQTPAWTTEERLQRIEALGQRINKYVQFMCEAGKLNATSAEANTRAIIAFYEQMVVMERQLGRIHDEFQLE